MPSNRYVNFQKVKKVSPSFVQTDTEDHIQGNADGVDASRGMYFISEDLRQLQCLVRRLLRESGQFLTEKQMQITDRILSGHTVHRTARELNTTPQNVYMHWKRAQKKLQDAWYKLKNAA